MADKQDYQKTANVLDRPIQSSKEAEKKEQNQFLKLLKKWNDRDQENTSNVSKEDLELFRKVARARKLYIEIRDEVAGIELDHSDIEAYQDIRTRAYSEYMTYFEELIGQIRNEFN